MAAMETETTLKIRKAQRAFLHRLSQRLSSDCFDPTPVEESSSRISCDRGSRTVQKNDNIYRLRSVLSEDIVLCSLRIFCKLWRSVRTRLCGNLVVITS